MPIYSEEVTGLTAKDSPKQPQFTTPAKYEFAGSSIFPPLSRPLNAKLSVEQCHLSPPVPGNTQYSLKQLKSVPIKFQLICSETPNRFAESQILQSKSRAIGRMTYSKSPPPVVRHLDDNRYANLKDQKMECTEDSFVQDGGSTITIARTHRDKDNKFVRKNSQTTFMRNKLYEQVFNKMKRSEEECVYLRSKFLGHMKDCRHESRLPFQSPRHKLP